MAFFFRPALLGFAAFLVLAAFPEAELRLVGFSPFFGLVGGFFKFLLIFMLFGLFFKMIGFWFWRKRGHAGKHWRWHHGHHGRYGGTPPWYDDEGEEPVMKA